MKKIKRNIYKAKKRGNKHQYSKNNQRKSNNSKVNVRINLKKGVIETFNEESKFSTKFRDFSDNGIFYRLFNKREIQELQNEILVKYQKTHGRIPTKKQIEIKRMIAENIDTSIYKALKNYDLNNFWSTTASLDYISIMLKKVERFKYETDKEYAIRVKKERMNALKAIGINIEYDLNGLLINRNNFFDNFAILKNALKMRAFSTVTLVKNNEQSKNERYKNKEAIFDSIEAKKDSEVKIHVEDGGINFEPLDGGENDFEPLHEDGIDFEPLYEDGIDFDSLSTSETFREHIFKPQGELRFEPLYDRKTKTKHTVVRTKNKKYTSAKGLIGKLRKKAKDTEFKKYIGKKIGVILLTGLTLFTFTGSSNIGSMKDVSAQDNANKTEKIETNIDSTQQQTIQDILNSNPILDDKIESIIIDEDNNPSNLEQSNQGNNDIDDIFEISNKETIDDGEKTIEIVNLNDALIEALGLGIDSECNISDGRYYSSPGQNGRYGNYSKIKTSIKINYIDAIESDGTYYKYDIKDGKSIADIKKEHPNAKISYHMISSGGMTLGWNDSNDNDIEIQLVKNALMSIKGYLSSEAMQFLCDNELSSEIDKNQYSKYFEEITNAMLQYQQDLQNNNANIER